MNDSANPHQVDGGGGRLRGARANIGSGGVGHARQPHADRAALLLPGRAARGLQRCLCTEVWSPMACLGPVVALHTIYRTINQGPALLAP